MLNIIAYKSNLSQKNLKVHHSTGVDRITPGAASEYQWKPIYTIKRVIVKFWGNQMFSKTFLYTHSANLTKMPTAEKGNGYGNSSLKIYSVFR